MHLQAPTSRGTFSCVVAFISSVPVSKTVFRHQFMRGALVSSYVCLGNRECDARIVSIISSKLLFFASITRLVREFGFDFVYSFGSFFSFVLPSNSHKCQQRIWPLLSTVSLDLSTEWSEASEYYSALGKCSKFSLIDLIVGTAFLRDFVFKLSPNNSLPAGSYARTTDG